MFTQHLRRGMSIAYVVHKWMYGVRAPVVHARSLPGNLHLHLHLFSSNPICSSPNSAEAKDVLNVLNRVNLPLSQDTFLKPAELSILLLGIPQKFLKNMIYTSSVGVPVDHYPQGPPSEDLAATWYPPKLSTPAPYRLLLFHAFASVHSHHRDLQDQL